MCCKEFPVTSGIGFLQRITLCLTGCAVGTAVYFHGEGVAAAQSACGPSMNPIVCENSRMGDPDWDVPIESDATCGLPRGSMNQGRPSECISGFATAMSVNIGDTIHFKVEARDPTPTVNQFFEIKIYRLGYYNGVGARWIADVFPLATAPSLQPGCQGDSTYGLVDCGNWAESATGQGPSNAVSGLYVGKVIRQDKGHAGAASHITFIVRDDNGVATGSPNIPSDILFQTSDETWQAYNGSGFEAGPGYTPLYGVSVYATTVGNAQKASYNRPVTTGYDIAASWYRDAEYPMIRWLERNGYYVSYTTGIENEQFGQRIKTHKVFLSVGHDEYWSAGQRNNVLTARDSGVSLAFFSGNEMFWKTRWEDSFRTLVTFK